MHEPAAGGAKLLERGLHLRYGLYTAGVVAFVLALGMLEGQGLGRGWVGALFLLATVAVYATIGLFCRTTQEDEYYVAGRRVPALYNGMATAADWMSAASFIGLAGVLYLEGFGGLAYVLGWTGGFCLVALLLAPHLRRFGQFTVPDFIGERYGNVARAIAVAAVVVASFVYVVVQIYGVGLVTSHMTGFSFEVGIFVGLGGVLVCSFLGGMRAVTWTQVSQYIVMILAYLVPVLWLSLQQTGHLLPQWGYGRQLQDVQAMEQRLQRDPRELEVRALWRQRAEQAQAKLGDVAGAVERDSRELAQRIQQMKLAQEPLARIQQAERQLSRLPRNEAAARQRYERDRALALAQARPLGGLAPQADPFPPGRATEPRRNFLALVLCLMMGTAALPHVLTRYYTTRSVAETRRSVGWSLFFIVLLYLSAPALAVMVKHEVLGQLVGSGFDELPGWIRRWAKIDPNLVSVEDVNGDGLLQLAELRLGGDVIMLAAPEIGGLPYVVTCLVAAGGLAAALSTADGLLLTVANALSHDGYYRLVNPHASAIRRVMLSKLLVLVMALLAAWVASLRAAAILPFVAAAFSLAASAFFPALVLGIYWRRATGPAAVAGMLTGLAVCGGYMALQWLPPAMLGALHGLAGERWWGIDPVAAGVFGVPAGVAVMLLVSLVAPASRPAQQGLVDRVRYPGQPLPL